MPVSIETLPLTGGRHVDILLGGDPFGTPIVMHHGTPSDATTYASWSEDCAARRLRLVCMSRPGYASSSRQPGRSVASAARDTAEVLDHLGAETFLSLGWSGGGPHALACAAMLGKRCRGVAVLAGVGPYEMAGVEFAEGMGPENVSEFDAAAAGETTLRGWMDAHAMPFRSVTGEFLVQAFGGLLPPVDQDVMQATFAEEMAAVIRRALSQGFDGWIDDDLAFTRPWGFSLGEIAAPVTLWQGEFDLMVPVAHARWMAERIPGARFEFVPGHGHISLVTQFRHHILDDLLKSEASARHPPGR